MCINPTSQHISILKFRFSWNSQHFVISYFPHFQKTKQKYHFICSTFQTFMFMFFFKKRELINMSKIQIVICFPNYQSPTYIYIYIFQQTKNNISKCHAWNMFVSCLKQLYNCTFSNLHTQIMKFLVLFFKLSCVVVKNNHLLKYQNSKKVSKISKKHTKRSTL